MRMMRCRVGVWIEQGSRNERTAPTRKGIVPCRSASHAGHERVWGSCGERGQTLVVAGLINQARRLCLSFLSESTPPPPSSFSFDRGGRGRKELVFFSRLSYVDRRSLMVLYHSEAWSCGQLQAGIVRNPAGIIVWCHSMVP